MLLKIILLVIFLILSAFFSSSETALFSLSKMYRKKLENSTLSNQRYAAKLLKHPKQLLTTILLGNTMVNVAIASLSAVIAIEISRRPLAIFIEIIIVTLIILIFGEIVPKVYAIQFAEKHASRIAFPIGAFKLILFPIVKILYLFTSFFTRAGKSQLDGTDARITSEDIKNIFDDKAGVDIPKVEREMINSAFEFSDTKVKEIMTPRVDITGLNIDDGIDKLIETIKNSGFSRMPIFVEKIDNIIGMVYSKDIILNHIEKKSIKNLMQNCFFVPENMKINYLLRYFQKNKIHLAIVVDEYGGTSGLVTLEDILEEIVGEILDETDVEKINIKQVAKDEYLIDSSADIDELNEKFGLEIDDNFDSFSGFLYQVFGKVPKKDETTTYKNKFEFSVEKIDGQRINFVKLKILETNFEI